MPIMTHKEFTREKSLYLGRKNNGKYITKENLNFGLKAASYAFFAPYHSVDGFAVGVISPLIISSAFTLIAAIAVMQAIYNVAKALFNYDNAGEHLKAAAACIPVAFTFAILSPVSQSLALLALITSSIATALSDTSKKEDKAPSVSCS